VPTLIREDEGMAMATLPDRITGGVDTHLDVHVAAALDSIGGVLGIESFPTTPAGYRRLRGWLQGFGEVDRVGVEGTGSYGAGLTRHLLDHGITVVEVDRPNRQNRRRRGKSDSVDAVAAARAALSGDARGAAKSRDGNVEIMRVLRLVKLSARNDRTRALNQMRSIISTAPAELRQELRDLPIHRLVPKAAALRPGKGADLTAATKLALRMLAQRVQAQDDEIAEINALLEPLVMATAPELVAQTGVGTDTASALLIAAGDNPERLRSERTFAHLCGTAPLDASSGKQERHRLSRSGDRQANAALWRIVMTRIVYDPRTKRYIERRMKDGLTKKEAMRCIKRYVARELFAYLPREKVA
jgi:transposase